MKKIFFSSLIAFALVMGTTAMAAVTLVNGGFEADVASNPFSDNTTVLNGWSVASGNIDHINGYWTASEGNQSIDLNGIVPAKIRQTFDTVIGATYTVTFDLSGNPDSRGRGVDQYYSPGNKQVEVSATDGAPATYSFDVDNMLNTRPSMMWQSHSYTFVATGTSTTLSFESKIEGAFGPALDNVQITEKLPTKNDCKKGGWMTMMDSQGNSFKNQGDCVSYFATNGKNLGSISH